MNKNKNKQARKMEEKEQLPLAALAKQVRQLPHGSMRVEAIRDAIRRADAAQNLYYRLDFRDDLVRELAFHGDRGKLLPVLADYVSLYERHPEPRLQKQYLYQLYSTVRQWDCHPQLPLDERTKAVEYFRSACLKYGESLQSYHELELECAIQEGRLDDAERHFQAYVDNPRNRFASCEACYQQEIVWYFCARENWEEALRQAKPILDGRLTCSLEPRRTYSCLLDFALDRGDWDACEHFGNLLRRYLSREEGHIAYWTDWIRWQAFYPRSTALRMFEWVLSYTCKEWNQSHHFDCYSAAWVLFTQLARQGQTSVFLRAPEKNFAPYREDNQYDVQLLADWFYEQAQTIAQKFDARSKYPFYQNLLQDTADGMHKMEQERRNHI